jgi:methylmalonyl-CoA mutase cobalamin-binding subunit
VVLMAVGAERRDRAIRVLARRLREAGHDVVVGAPADAGSLLQSLGDDAPVVVGMSIGATGDGVGTLLASVRARRGSTRVFAGGRSSSAVTTALAHEHGVHLFSPDATTREILAWIADGPP